MRKRTLNYLTISDLHFGHETNKTTDIIENLHTYFKENHKEIENLDLLVINGDVYHKLLPHSSREVLLVTEWFMWLFKLCIKNKIVLRVTHGTISHDMNQVEHLEVLIKDMDIEGLDFGYVKDISIEYHKGLGIQILYVPDNIYENGTGYEEYITALLKTHNLTRVDIAFIHGNFHFQLPIKLDSSLNEAYFLNITKYYIHVGHIHTFNTYERIIGNGSFDRLAHGEEGSKGGVFVVIDLVNETSRYKFVENIHAKYYKSFKIDVTDIDDFLNDIVPNIKKLPEDSRVQLVLKKDNPLLFSVPDMTRVLPEYKVSIKKIGDVTESTQFLEKKDISSQFDINKHNVISLLEKKVDVQKIDMGVFHTELKKLVY
jgi:DNA repair exonuclease SbcCD nuclease subunit